MTKETGNTNSPLHKNEPVPQGSLLGCRRGSEGSAGTYLCVCVSDGIIHQHHDQDGDGDPKVSDDPPRLQNTELSLAKGTGQLHAPAIGCLWQREAPNGAKHRSTADGQGKETQP